MAKFEERNTSSSGSDSAGTSASTADAVASSSPTEADKLKLQNQQEQYHQLQRDLADAISRLASLDDIRILLACGARANGPVTQGLHPIHYAVYQNFVPAVRLLLLRGSDINAMDDNGYTPVHLCSERGYKELLEFLISQGAKVCFTDIRRQTSNLTTHMADEPLSLAIKRGHRECVELLLKNGADPNARYFMGAEINLVSILEIRCIELLLKYGAHPDSRDRTGLTPLMKAARHPQGYATCKLLIEYGADVNDIAGERHDYRTVLHHSIFSGNLDMIRLILSSGARYPRLEFDKPSPLDIAIISGRHDIVKLLIEFEADVNAGSNTTIGQPLHTALTQRIENKREIVKILLDSGANPNSVITSNRSTGPALHDYLNAVRQCGGGGGGSGAGASGGAGGGSTGGDRSRAAGGSFQSPYAPFSCNPNGPDLDIVRMLMMYGARVILKTQTQNQLGLVRTLERVQDDMSLDLLNLLIDAAEEIDWFMMSKVIYSCLRNANRWRTNELFDPSVSATMTPVHLAELLADKSAHYYGVSEDLVKLLNGGKNSSAVLSLKQITRITIRRHLIDQTNVHGRILIEQIMSLAIPSILKQYLLYQL